jgi:hypothetical protein
MFEYKYLVPDYIYRINVVNPLLELYRYSLINKYTNYIIKKLCSDYNLTHSKISRKINQYFSQLIMSIYTNRTYKYKEKIYLDDGLFNSCSDQEVMSFYHDIKYLVSIDIKEDIFNIKRTIDDFLVKIDDFSKNLDNTKIYTRTDDYFLINQEILDKHHFKLDNKYEINRELYESCKKRCKDQKNYDNLILSLLIRYRALNSGANQYVVDLNYKKILKEKFGLNFECFGSVFNRYYDHFCSLFYDLEKYFGSLGSFMSLKVISGFYMANPPYDENLLKKMYKRVKKNIKSDDQVCFIMSIPKWDEYDLEKLIDLDKLYDVKIIKHEKFRRDMDKKQEVLIPPYISYIFSNQSFKKNTINYIDLVDIFSNYKNYDNTKEYYYNKKKYLDEKNK